MSTTIDNMTTIGTAVPIALWSIGNLTNDSLTAIIHPNAVQPFYMIPMSAGVKYIGTVLVFGFMLKTKNQVPNTGWKGNVKALVGIFFKFGFMGLAINAYYKDIIEIHTLGITYAPIVLCLSPNFIAAMALWNKIAKQSPIAICKFEATYNTLSCLGPMSFPLCLGTASWIGPVEQIYALLLLPYMIPKFLLLLISGLGGMVLFLCVGLPYIPAACGILVLLCSFVWYLPVWIYSKLFGDGGAAWSFLVWGWSLLSQFGWLTIQGSIPYIYFLFAIWISSEITFLALIFVYSELTIGKEQRLATLRIWFSKTKTYSNMLRKFMEAEGGTVREPLLGPGSGPDDCLPHGDNTEEDHKEEETDKKANNKNILSAFRPWMLVFPKPFQCTEDEVTALKSFNTQGETTEPSVDCPDIGHKLDQFKLRLILSDMRDTIWTLVLMQALVTVATRVIIARNVGWTFSWATITNTIEQGLLTVSERHWDTYVQSLRVKLDIAASKGTTFAYSVWTLV